MKAVLLAGGLGSRLRPLTDTVPKCLVRVGDRSLLDIWLDALTDVGVDEVVVNTHHLANQVEDHVAARAGGPVVHLVHEPVLRGSAGTLRACADLLRGDDFFLAINADNLTDFDLGLLIGAHRCGDRLATLTAFRAPRPTQCGILEVRDDRLVGFEEKPAHPVSDLANAGIYAFGPGVLDLIEGTDPQDVGGDLLPRLVGHAGVLDIGSAYFADIGTPEALDTATRTWRNGVTL